MPAPLSPQNSKRRRVLIVDGYNVIRNNPRYQALGIDYEGKSAWNKARETLITDTAMLAKADYEKATIVFDGAGNPASTGQPQNHAGVTVIFSPHGKTADTVIEKLAHDARERGLEVTVVSSDFSIQTTVFGGGVTRMSAAGFSGAAEQEEIQDYAAAPLPTYKTPLAARINPEVAAQLAAAVRKSN